MSLLVKINQSDNVAIAVQPLSAGSEVEGIHINQDIPQAHKVALADIPKGSPVIRYGVILGYAMNPDQTRRLDQRIHARTPNPAIRR